MELDEVGVFEQGDGYWESSPINMHGSLLSIESADISADQILRAQRICSNWSVYVDKCFAYIESVRNEYGLTAKRFTNPNAFIGADDEWSIYFDTESEVESVVGVEFRGESPFQLIIGD